MQEQEIVYYSDASTKITSESARVGGKTYRLADIASVNVWTTQTEAARNVPALLIVAGSILMFAVTNLQNLFPVEWDGVMPAASALGMLIALSGLTVLIMQAILKTDYLYIVRLSGSFGSACPFACEDERYVRTIATAIKSALKDRQAEAVAGSPILANIPHS